MQQFDDPVVAAITLIQSHADKGPAQPGGSHYAQHRAAEVEAWDQRELHIRKAGDVKAPAAEFWAHTAVTIADMRFAAEHPETDVDRRLAD